MLNPLIFEREHALISFNGVTALVLTHCLQVLFAVGTGLGHNQTVAGESETPVHGKADVVNEHRPLHLHLPHVGVVPSHSHLRLPGTWISWIVWSRSPDVQLGFEDWELGARYGKVETLLSKVLGQFAENCGNVGRCLLVFH